MMSMFHEGDTAIEVKTPVWNGPRSYRVVKIGKIHKTGRLTLEGCKDQWKFRRGGYSGVDCFVPTSPYSHKCLHPFTKELKDELDFEALQNKKRIKLNKIGDNLSRIRDLKVAADLFDKLPEEIRQLKDT